MPAKEFLCKVIEAKWLTPTVVELRFSPSKRFRFEAGQFVSVVVPAPAGARRPLRRAYSLAAASEVGFRLCVKVVPGGPGSNYIASLKAGDTFKAFAPYGDFEYDANSGRDVCFISTGTGVAPFMAMAQSRAFQENRPARAINLFGARTEDEIIYPGVFEALGVQEVNAISRPGPGYAGFTGRVTDYLRSLPPDWAWDQTDFYLCGSGDMVAEVRRHLRGRGVAENRIHQEVYFVAPDRLQKAPAAAAPTRPTLVPPPIPVGAPSVTPPAASPASNDNVARIVTPPPFKKTG